MEKVGKISMNKINSVMTDKTVLEISYKSSMQFINQDSTGRYYMSIDGKRTEIFYWELGHLISDLMAEKNVNILVENLEHGINIVFKKDVTMFTFFGYGKTKEECINNIIKFIRLMKHAGENKNGRHSKHKAKGKMCKNCAYFVKNSCGINDCPLCELGSQISGETLPWMCCNNHKPDKSWTLPSKWVSEDNKDNHTEKGLKINGTV